MGATSIWHWIILLLIVVLLFGRGKISEIMGDVAKGIKSFKQGMAEDDAASARPGEAVKDPKIIDHAPQKSTDSSTDKSRVG